MIKFQSTCWVDFVRLYKNSQRIHIAHAHLHEALLTFKCACVEIFLAVASLCSTWAGIANIYIYFNTLKKDFLAASVVGFIKSSLNSCACSLLEL